MKKQKLCVFVKQTAFLNFKLPFNTIHFFFEFWQKARLFNLWSYSEINRRAHSNVYSPFLSSKKWLETIYIFAMCVLYFRTFKLCAWELRVPFFGVIVIAFSTCNNKTQKIYTHREWRRMSRITLYCIIRFLFFFFIHSFVYLNLILLYNTSLLYDVSVSFRFKYVW